MKPIPFDGAGAPLSVNITFQSQTAEDLYATYTYTLWATGSNTVVDQKSGNNFNDEDDNYWLPTPASGNNNRIIDVFSTLKNAGESDIQVNITVELHQGTAILGSDTDTKTVAASSTAFSQIFIKLLTQQ